MEQATGRGLKIEGPAKDIVAEPWQRREERERTLPSPPEPSFLRMTVGGCGVFVGGLTMLPEPRIQILVYPT
jgi:hypothetical protein